MIACKVRLMRTKSMRLGVHCTVTSILQHHYCSKGETACKVPSTCRSAPPMRRRHTCWGAAYGSRSGAEGWPRKLPRLSLVSQRQDAENHARAMIFALERTGFFGQMAFRTSDDTRDHCVYGWAEGTITSRFTTRLSRLYRLYCGDAL